MDNKFVYVFDINMRDKLLSANYRLLKSDGKQNIFIFENKGTLSFESNDKRNKNFIFSDTLTF